MKVIGANFAKKVEINNTGKNIVLGYTDKSGKFRVIRVDRIWKSGNESLKKINLNLAHRWGGGS